MHTSLAPGFSWKVWVERLALVLAFALVLGSLGASQADAIKKFTGKTHTSVGDRVLAQSDLCYADGGAFSMSRNAFGATVTTCTGGSQGDWKCTNSKKQTSCGPAYTPPPPPDDGGAVPPTDEPPPTQGDDSTTSGGGSGTDEGSTGSSGGGLTPPGISPDNPSVSDGGGVVLTAYDGGKSAHAKHRGRHHQQGHDKGRKK
jgi:hypothetical protein